MSIRSIDMQVLIPRATEVQKHQSNIVQQGALQQQQFAEEMQKTAEVKQHQVQDILKSQNSKVKRDETKDNQSSNSYSRKGTALNQVETEEQENAENNVIGEDPILGHIIDIKT
ncbi:hypothetical protein [Sporomusa sp.]|jgi:hypothetical protein|uniref:hypothetical protein n=1 Tax=Sporomusa sp. TaxID=2078658 RepID=UPI002BB01BAA|nr:hypothetical protein [Sporomusa sp.]MDF2875372.1 hypothetical protein [Sporomusa sp.]HWR08197.1 hypothetical protein [Sporomusa sp.]